MVLKYMVLKYMVLKYMILKYRVLKYMILKYRILKYWILIFMLPVFLNLLINNLNKKKENIRQLNLLLSKQDRTHTNLQGNSILLHNISSTCNKIEKLGSKMAYLLASDQEILAGYRHDELMITASVRKISIMLTVLYYLQGNKLPLSHRLQVKAYHLKVETPFQHNKKNNIFQKQIKTRMNFGVDELLFFMIHLSDNVATFILSEWVTLPFLNKYLKKIGLHQANHKYLFPSLKNILPHEHTRFTLNEIHKLLSGIMNINGKQLYLSNEKLKFAKKLLGCHRHQKLSLFIKKNSYQKGGSLPHGMTDALAIWDSLGKRYLYLIIFLQELPLDSNTFSRTNTLLYFRRKLEKWGYMMEQEYITKN